MNLESPKSKKNLNKVTYSVRASQIILQYGVGAMIDFPDQTLMTAAPEYWEQKVIHIHDERLEKALHADYFGMPREISYVQFPEWYFCPKCRKFQPIKQWRAEYAEKLSHSNYRNLNLNTANIKCATCNQNLVVARIVTVCENGHINDFPWIKWVHRRNKSGTVEVCSNPSLTFKTGTSASEGLEGLIITCETCGASATLKGAFDPNIFEKMDKESGKNDFRCEGNLPHKHVKENCDKYPRTMQRGSSSVYFPATLSSLVIPPYSGKLTEKIEGSEAFKTFNVIIEDEDQKDENRIQNIEKKISKWTHKIAMEIGTADSQVENILNRKFLDKSDSEYDIESVKYRAEEYDALNGSANMSDEDPGGFSRKSINIESYGLRYLKGISLITKMREVRVLAGFTRLSPPVGINKKDDPHFVPVKEPETRWYPAYEVRGEGIFIEFSQEDIKKWIVNNLSVIERVEIINKNYKDSFIGKQKPRIFTPKFVLLHTLSHLLIKQLSFECGYSIASLRERIYCSEQEEGKEMSGIFIYTASGDSEGTLGGLVRQGMPDSFGRIFRKAIESAKICSNDPVCILSHGQGRDSLNLAACHACTLIPETSCEEYNMFLDRGLVVGTFEDKNIGFFSNF